mgnify:FL=1
MAGTQLHSAQSPLLTLWSIGRVRVTLTSGRRLSLLPLWRSSLLLAAVRRAAAVRVPAAAPDHAAKAAAPSSCRTLFASHLPQRRLSVASRTSSRTVMWLARTTDRRASERGRQSHWPRLVMRKERTRRASPTCNSINLDPCATSTLGRRQSASRQVGVPLSPPLPHGIRNDGDARLRGRRG